VYVGGDAFKYSRFFTPIIPTICALFSLFIVNTVYNIINAIRLNKLLNIRIAILAGGLGLIIALIPNFVISKAYKPFVRKNFTSFL
jgi:hypothetical protein